MTSYVMGIDAGTESIRSVIYDAQGRSLSTGIGDNTSIYPHPGWCEQNIYQWESSLITSIRAAISGANIEPEQIVGIGIDATCSTVVHLDTNGKPLRDAMMWMDIRATEEAQLVNASGDAALKYTGGDNVSAEWFPGKNLWVKRHQPTVYRDATTIFDQVDWLAFWLTGERTASINTSTVRWFYDRRNGGFPESLYRYIGLEDIFDKIPSRIVTIGETVGGLRGDVAEWTGLSKGIPVAAGGADASLGMIGMNVLTPGRLALVTGSSQILLGVTDTELHAPGIFGTYPDVLVPGTDVIEAGQTSTGSVLKWFVSQFCSTDLRDEAIRRGMSPYQLLDEKSAEIPLGSEGLVVLDHWQGNRSPWVDANSRGVIRGLTLRHTPAHVYRAIMEGVAYGTAVILDRMRKGGVSFDEIVACGGATNSALWMQIIADVTGKDLVVPEAQQAVSLGSAIAATVAAGLYPSLASAAEAMVKTERVIAHNAENTTVYAKYIDQYEFTYSALNET